eukprot:sb/3471135/
MYKLVETNIISSSSSCLSLNLLEQAAIHTLQPAINRTDKVPTTPVFGVLLRALFTDRQTETVHSGFSITFLVRTNIISSSSSCLSLNLLEQAAIHTLQPAINRTDKVPTVNLQWTHLLPRIVNSLKPRPAGISIKPRSPNLLPNSLQLGSPSLFSWITSPTSSSWIASSNSDLIPSSPLPGSHILFSTT